MKAIKSGTKVTDINQALFDNWLDLQRLSGYYT